MAELHGLDDRGDEALQLVFGGTAARERRGVVLGGGGFLLRQPVLDGEPVDAFEIAVTTYEHGTQNHTGGSNPKVILVQR